MNTLLRQPNPSELAKILNYKPNYWQSMVRESKARFKVLVCGSRSGKSFYVANDSIDGVVSDLGSRNSRVWVVAPNFSLTSLIWDEIIKKSYQRPFSDLIKTRNNTKGMFKITTHLGTQIECKSADEPDKLVGEKLTKLVIDECGLVKEKAWRQSLRPRLIDLKGSAMFVGTPKGKNWFYDLYLKGQDPEQTDWDSWRFSTFENKDKDTGKLLLPLGEIEKAKRDMPDYEYRQEILAEFTESATQVFRNIRGCVKEKGEEPINEFTEPKKPSYNIGIDLGRKYSYTAICVINRRTHHLEYIDRFRKIDWELQKKRIMEIVKKYDPDFLRIDATGIGDVFCEDLENAGVRVDPFIFTETSKKQLIDKLSIFIDQGRISYPPNDILLSELERFGREITEQGRVHYKALGKYKDDCVMALALAVWDLEDAPLDEKAGEIMIPDIQTY